jgi:uncharacterized membrane protein HdeD (DUF308 family)
MTTAEATQLETKQHPWWVTLMGGILSVVVGILLLSMPVKSAYFLIVTLGFYWIISGIFTLVGMFVDHTAWGWKLIMGIISIMAGTVILRYPLISMVKIPQIFVLILGIQGIFVGLMSLIMAFKGGGWGAGILGALSIIFGVILMVNWDSLGMTVTVFWVVAIFALVGGIFQIVQAFRLRSAT